MNQKHHIHGGGRKGSPVLIYVCVFVTLVLAMWAVSWLYMGMKVLTIRKFAVAQQMAEHVNSLTEHVANTAINLFLTKNVFEFHT